MIKFYSGGRRQGKTMQRDNNLLEMAAKAAGYEFSCFEGVEPRARKENGVASSWNPLCDDGDALRLAIHLGINIWRDDDLLWVNHAKLAFTGDPMPMLRRAIVCTAAEMVPL